MAAGAGGRSRLRTSDADRGQVVELLKAAFVQGRLAKDEFDVRVGQVLASRTYAELDAITAGIPDGAAAVQPPRTRLGAYAASRKRKSAIGQYERALADQERMHGRDHPDTIAARAALAAALRTAGKMRNAIRQYERVLADRSGSAAVTTRTPSRPAPTWPSPTAARDGCGRPSRPTSGRSPTGNASRDAITRTP